MTGWNAGVGGVLRPRVVDDLPPEPNGGGRGWFEAAVPAVQCYRVPDAPPVDAELRGRRHRWRRVRLDPPGASEPQGGWWKCLNHPADPPAVSWVYVLDEDGPLWPVDSHHAQPARGTAAPAGPTWVEQVEEQLDTLLVDQTRTDGAIEFIRGQLGALADAVATLGNSRSRHADALLAHNAVLMCLHDGVDCRPGHTHSAATTTGPESAPESTESQDPAEGVPE